MHFFIILLTILNILSCNKKGSKGGHNFCPSPCETDKTISTGSLEVDETAKDELPDLVYQGMSLHGALDDGYLNASEATESLEIVSSLSATGYSEKIFILAKANQDCSNLDYKSEKQLDLFSRDLGHYKVCLRLIDLRGKLFFAESESFMIDLSGPLLTFAGAPSSFSNKTELNLSVDGAKSYRFAFIEGSDCLSAEYGDWTSSGDFRVEDTGSDGIKSICIEAKDEAGNKMKALAQTWAQDTVAPSAPADLASLPAAINALESIDIGVSGEDIYEFRYELIRGNDCQAANFTDHWILASNTISKKLGSDGDYIICVQGRDEAGNLQPGISQHHWTKDTRAPGSAILSNTPLRYSTDSSISITVSGEEIAEYRYTFLSSGSCDGVMFSGDWLSPSTPISETLEIDQDYSLCVVGRNNLGVEQPFLSQFTWTRDTVAPQQVDVGGTPNNPSRSTSINVSAGGPDIAAYRYDLVIGADCSTASFSGNWISAETPITEPLGIDQQYTLCIQGRDAAGNEQSSVTSYTWTKDSTALIADVIGMPTGISPSTMLDVTVSGQGATHYIYKVGIAVDCSVQDGYSAPIPVTTKITDDLSNFDDGQMTLCVLAVDIEGYTQDLASASQTTWTKDENVDPGIPYGHFDIDTSSKLYAFGKGDTDGHVHDYDDKYDTKEADFLSFLDSKLKNLTDKLNSNQRFRIMILNAGLSPMGILSINGTQTNVVDFQDYFNTQAVYSMEGLTGTTKLDSFKIMFPDETFMNNGMIATSTGCVQDNDAGPNGEYRNGALVIQVVDADGYTIDSGTGLLSSGLIWEVSLFWHKDRKCYK